MFLNELYVLGKLGSTGRDVNSCLTLYLVHIDNHSILSLWTGKNIINYEICHLTAGMILKAYTYN